MRIAMVAGAIALVAASSAASASGASRPVAWCSAIPTVNITPQEWGFHGGQPIAGATGSYTRGHGKINLTAGTASGIICQVDRVRTAPDRQIVLSVDSKVIYTSHYATMFGVPGNIMEIHVHVKSSTDPKCAVGTRGKATIFASYNNVHKDSIEFAFPAACRRHSHRYTGPDVVTNVPPN
jgi:hypothetical protein